MALLHDTIQFKSLQRSFLVMNKVGREAKRMIGLTAAMNPSAAFGMPGVWCCALVIVCAPIAARRSDMSGAAVRT